MKKSGGKVNAKAGSRKVSRFQESPQGQASGKVLSTPLKTKEGAPIIYSQGTVRYQASKQAYKEELHIYLRKHLLQQIH